MLPAAAVDAGRADDRGDGDEYALHVVERHAGLTGDAGVRKVRQGRCADGDEGSKAGDHVLACGEIAQLERDGGHPTDRVQYWC